MISRTTSNMMVSRSKNFRVTLEQIRIYKKVEPYTVGCVCGLCLPVLFLDTHPLLSLVLSFSLMVIRSTAFCPSPVSLLCGVRDSNRNRAPIRVLTS